MASRTRGFLEVNVKKLVLDCEAISAIVGTGRTGSMQEASARVELTREKPPAVKKTGGRGSKQNVVAGPRDVISCLGWRGACHQVTAEAESGDSDDEGGGPSSGPSSAQPAKTAAHLLK
ncbi:unnamed protein product [Prorocentrum cordatum]|uniref:Uncharacterized protein n=1 Tax=Prorocentrum cordatum TaxID=2364126 RepID=A0ABN9UPS4_9DINO|nr:unnamed protein product [Polarella glacialis]